MARQISVSNDVYQELVKIKGKRSFSEVISEVMGFRKKNREFMKLAGSLKSEHKALQEMKALIERDREANYGRKFD